MNQEELTKRINESELPEVLKEKALRIADKDAVEYPDLVAKVIDLFETMEAETKKDSFDPVANTMGVEDSMDILREQYPDLKLFERRVKEAHLDFMVDIEKTSTLPLMQRAFLSSRFVEILESGSKLVGNYLLTSAYDSDEAFNEARNKHINIELKKIREEIESGVGLTEAEQEELRVKYAETEAELSDLA